MSTRVRDPEIVVSDQVPTSPTRSTHRSPWRPGPSLLGLFTGWVALFSWGGMVARPSGFLVATLLVGGVMVLVGSGLRALDLPAYAVALVQLAIGLLGLNSLFAPGQSLLGLVPTVDSVRHVAFVINNGAATLNHYSAPVGVNPTHTRAMLLACGLAVVLSIDVLAMGLRRPPLIALPLLVTLSVPVSILRDPLALPVFAGVALLFLRLLAVENLERFQGWGGRPGRAARSRTWADPLSDHPTKLVLSTLWQISIVAVLVALLAAPLVPLGDLLHRDGDGTGTGGSGNGRYRLTSVNPFINLRRDLLTKNHIPLVYATTNALSTSYLRTAVLDEFTSKAWLPSTRNLPRANDANGPFPTPPGLASGVSSSQSEWSLELAPNFTTTWLPLPYPIHLLDVRGDWRYDSRTLDVVYVGGPSSRIKYHASAFTPHITAELLNSAVQAPESLRGPMTELPKDLPAVIGDRAREVTRGADNDFAKALALQEWFRTGGGFRYSVEQRSGSGMDLLASFVTNDRVGYCEQFAAAMAAMGRSLGIPSRVVVGFLDGTPVSGGRILYTSDDRHAWPEMFFTGVGWVRFEPTPGQRAASAPSWTRSFGDTPVPTAKPSARGTQRPTPATDQAPTDVSTGGDNGLPVPWWPGAALLVVLVLGISPGLVRRVQRRRRLSGSDPVHLAEGAWAELRATALDLGLTWSDQRSPREQARGMVGQVQAEDQDLQSLEGLLVRVEQERFGRRGTGQVEAGVRTSTLATVGSWRRVMTASVNRRRGWRGRVWPVSVVRRAQ